MAFEPGPNHHPTISFFIYYNKRYLPKKGSKVLPAGKCTIDMGVKKIYNISFFIPPKKEQVYSGQ